MTYLPIESHGIIGDMHSIALVGTNGTIDWCCLPHFDSPSVFASLLDHKIGGHFALTAVGTNHTKQMYLPDSNILLTRAYTADGLGQIEDFMPVIPQAQRGANVTRVIRRVSCVRGTVQYHLDCLPAPDFARSRHTPILDSRGVVFETDTEVNFALASPLPLTIHDQSATLTFTLQEGEHLSFTFFCFPKNLVGTPFSLLSDPDARFSETHRFWKDWIGKCTYRGRWGEMVYRSALVLKLLTFEPTGAIIAAPTLGLPELVGGGRNWDYRYTWIRDASFTLYALNRVGYVEETSAFMNWLEARCAELNATPGSLFNPLNWLSDNPPRLSSVRPPLNIMYGIQGNHDLTESDLAHLEGYRQSRPVRLGNGAHDQLQLDIYGELIDAVYIFSKQGRPISYNLWSNIRKIADWVAENWDQKDAGIWETRGGSQNFVFSRLMCWVALDRALRIMNHASLPGSHNKWLTSRDAIYDQIMTIGWNPTRQAFRQHFGTDALDASSLMMPLVQFLSPTDPRMQSNIDAVLTALTRDSLVHRYDISLSPDGLDGEEGTFSICTFWLVECLARSGRLDEAHLIFQKMLGYANHLGLYSEEIGLHGEMLGNFPQAFTHLGLISAAVCLDRELVRK